MALHQIGSWYAKVREAFIDTAPCSYLIQRIEAGAGQKVFRFDHLLLIRCGNIIYVHCPNDLQTETAVLSGFVHQPRTHTLLKDSRSLPFVVNVIPWRRTSQPCLRVRGLPVNEISDEVLVIMLELDDESMAYPSH